MQGEKSQYYYNPGRDYALPRFREKIKQLAEELEKSGVRLCSPKIRADDRFVAQETVVLSRDRQMYACAPASVINAAKALGIDPATDIQTLAHRLWASHQVGSRQEPEKPPLLIEREGFSPLWTTLAGIECLMELIKHPLGREDLPMTTYTTRDVGKAHEAFLNGCTGVFLDEELQHAIAIVGAYQKGNDACWLVVPPDDTILAAIRFSLPDRVSITYYHLPPRVLFADPTKLLENSRMALPIWLMRLNSNPLQPIKINIEPEEMEAIEDIGVIQPQ